MVVLFGAGGFATYSALSSPSGPASPEEAIDAFEADPLTRDVFGPAMHKAWIDFKREEWSSYHNHVSDWEQDRYLKFF